MRHFFGMLMRLALLASLTSACGGGGSGGTTPAPLVTGSLALAVTGLPSGVAGAVSVTGPAAFTRTVSASATLDGLAVGSYTIAAAKVLSGSTVLLASPASQQVQVTAGATASASVVYAAQGTLGLALQSVVAGLDFPVFLSAPTDDARLFIVERSGRIRVVEQGIVRAAPFLDVSARTSTDGEHGLLSLAFHPQYAANGLFFIYYTDLNGRITVERYHVSGTDANLADPLSAVTVLSIAHPQFNNHNGGLISFGPDGDLYVGVGDGGGAGDPSHNAQDPNVLLGKLLRIDVSNTSASHPYDIPSTNPFASAAGKRGEIWAYGLRNPWRYAFDPASSLLYIADVGQDAREEVDIAPIGQAGNNYGWSIMEGGACYNAASCSQSGLTLPAFEYLHGAADVNGCAITGGYVYRGSALPELAGRYLYSDYCAGWLKSFLYSGGVLSEQRDWSIGNVGNITSFGQDGHKELYLLSANGTVYRIVRK